MNGQAQISSPFSVCILFFFLFLTSLLLLNIFFSSFLSSCGPVYVIGTSTRKWLESADRIPVGGEVFRTHPALASCTLYFFHGVKRRPGRGVDHPRPPGTEVQERMQLYRYNPSGHSWPNLEWPLSLRVFFIVMWFLSGFLSFLYFSLFVTDTHTHTHTHTQHILFLAVNNRVEISTHFFFSIL